MFESILDTVRSYGPKLTEAMITFLIGISKKFYVRDLIFDIVGVCYIHFRKKGKGL